MGADRRMIPIFPIVGGDVTGSLLEELTSLSKTPKIKRGGGALGKVKTAGPSLPAHGSDVVNFVILEGESEG